MNMTMSKPKMLAAAGIVAALGLGIGTASAMSVSYLEDTNLGPGYTIDGNDLVVAGTGCPPGSVVAIVSPDEKSVTVAFSKYTAGVGPGAGFAQNHKACTTTFPIRVPSGYTWGITTATYRGYADLHDGATVTQGATYFFQGGTSGHLEGPVTPDQYGQWTVTDQVATISYAPCNTQTNLVVTSSLTVNSPKPKPETDSYATMDTQDIRMESQNMPAMTFGLHFKKC